MVHHEAAEEGQETARAVLDPTRNNEEGKAMNFNRSEKIGEPEIEVRLLDEKER